MNSKQPFLLALARHLDSCAYLDVESVAGEAAAFTATDADSTRDLAHSTRYSLGLAVLGRECAEVVLRAEDALDALRDVLRILHNADCGDTAAHMEGRLTDFLDGLALCADS